MLNDRQDMPSPSDLLDLLRALRTQVHTQGEEIFARWAPAIKRRAFCISGLNLAHYLALRRHDLRDLQAALTSYGLSSLGRSEARVLQNLDAVIATLEAMNKKPGSRKRPRLQTFFRGERMLQYNTRQIFGHPPPNRRVRIMVTFPTEAASDYDFVRDLVERGMNCARINCAHDTPEVWEAMIANIRRAEAELECECKIIMDLGGPKPRTVDVRTKERVKIGDRILLRRDAPEKSREFRNQVRCSLPQVLDQLEVGQRVWIDDGKIGTVIDEARPEGVVLRVTHAREKGERIREEKGLNFPDTDLKLSPLTDDDLKALDFVATHADMIGYSFVQDSEDIWLLQRELAARCSTPYRIAIIAKIETRRAIHNLPELIAHAAGKQPFGVMIARGDLAVEVGYERMAEIQEELLWLCEAAHVPVIWATQVLERFVKKGTPSRGEMTDAAMAVRAECVMLNKGPYVGEAITILDNVMGRMQEHQTKKTPKLRALNAWTGVVEDNGTH